MTPTTGIVSLLPIIIGSLFALGCLIGAFFFLRRKRLIDDLPTSKAYGVFIGITELNGTAETETPLTSYLSAAKCVEYKWHVDEHWSRTVTTTSTDAQGHMHTSTHTESGWTTVAHGGQSEPFYLQDDTGVILIVPEGADIRGKTVFNETCGRENPLYFGKAEVPEIANSTHRRRFQETSIPLHAMLYVIGQAKERQDVVAAEIAQDKKSPMFIISTQTEKQVSRGFGVWYWVLFSVGMVLVLTGAGITEALGQAGLYWQLFVISAGGYLVATGIGWVWTVFNGLISLNQRVKQAWSEVDVQLKRRNDLIPNLIQCVAGYKGYERYVQEDITQLRSRLTATPPGEPGADFSGIRPTLQIIMESYPELKANESFLKLQQSLTETEQRIALARDYFNNITTFYNTRLQIIPDRFVAAIARLKARQLMGAADFERAEVKVNLAS